MSYQNLILYGEATPMYDDEKEPEGIPFDESKDANNPENFMDEEDEVVVRA